MPPLFPPARKQLLTLLTKSTFLRTTTTVHHHTLKPAYSRLGVGFKNYSTPPAFDRTNLSHKQKHLIDTFNSTKSTQQLLQTYDEMETCFEADKLAVECFALVESLLGQNRGEDAKIIMMKANKIVLGNEKCSSGNPCSLDDDFWFLFAKVCNRMGSDYFESKEYDKCLKILNCANTILSDFENDETSVCEGNCVLRALAVNEYLLLRVTMLMGKLVESALHAKKSLEVKEKFMEEGCHDLALANMDAFFAYSAAVMCNEALPYGWKALEIHTKNLGCDHLEVAKMRKNLAYVYRLLGENDKAREQDELAKNVIESLECPDNMIKAGRYAEAIEVLKGNVSRDDVKEEDRGMDLVSMANAFYEMGKYSDAKKHFKSALEILEKCPGNFNRGLVMMTFLEISGLYMEMKDTEGALSLLKKLLAFPDLSQNLFPRAALRYLSFVPESDKAKEEIPYMLELVEKMKLISGPEHCDIGYGCQRLGVAYWNSGQQELAVKFMEDAKSILDAANGPNHIDSLKTSHTLSEFYGRMGRYALALEIEKKVVEGLKGLPQSELGFMRGVNKHLGKMKERVSESPTTASSRRA